MSLQVVWLCQYAYIDAYIRLRQRCKGTNNIINRKENALYFYT